MADLHPGDYDDDGDAFQSPSLGPGGALHSVGTEVSADDAVARLREVVAEVTNGRIPAPVKRFGFY